MNEIWLDVVGFEGFYKVSNFGNIFSVRNNIKIRHKIEKNGYARVGFNVNGKSTTALVHRIVCEAFIGKCPLKYDVNHKNSNRCDNRIENLEYLPRSENVRITFIGKKRGAYRDKVGYRARIYYNGKHHHIKTTKTKEEAHEAFYQEYIRIYGEKPW
jgi:hypothetical protein